MKLGVRIYSKIRKIKNRSEIDKLIIDITGNVKENTVRIIESEDAKTSFILGYEVIQDSKGVHNMHLILGDTLISDQNVTLFSNIKIPNEDSMTEFKIYEYR
jgi:hypothetical protein